MLNTAGQLITASLGVTLVFKTGMFNLGGEGQIYTGAFTAAAVSIFLADFNSPLMIIIILASAAAAGACAGFISGYLKNKWDTNELISSFLLSSALIHIINYFITGSMADENSYLITTKAVSESFRLKQLLPPSKLNGGFLQQFPQLFSPIFTFIKLPADSSSGKQEKTLYLHGSAV